MPEKADKSENERIDKIEGLLARISELNSSEKSRFLRKLVKRTATRNSREMNFLRSLVMAVPLGSNLDKLPGEVFSQVLSYLDAKTLGKLAGSCKKLSVTILGDHRPWKKIFETEDQFGRLSEVTKQFQFQIAQSIQNSASKSIVSPHSSSLPYTAAFFYESRLQRNWSKVVPGERPVGFDCHGSHVVTCMEIDPKGRYILTGSDDGTVRLWSTNVVNEQREMGVYTGHLGGVWALKVDWERRILVTGSTDRTLIVWDLHSGERLEHLLGHTSTVRCVELYDDFVISGSRDGTLRVWSLIGGECLHLLQGHTASVRCLSLGPIAGTIVSGSYDNTCRLWDIYTGECLKVFEGHTNKVYAVTSTSDQIYSGSLDGSVRVWDPCSGECVKKFDGHRSLVGLVQAKESLMRDVVVTGSTDGSLQIIKKLPDESYDTTILPSAHPSSITSLDFNRHFLVTGSEGVVRLWSLESGRSEPCLLANLIENLDMVWRVVVNDNLAVIAYQVQGQTRLAIFNFAPPPQQILIEMRAFKTHSSNQGSVYTNNKMNLPQIHQSSRTFNHAYSSRFFTSMMEIENNSHIDTNQQPCNLTDELMTIPTASTSRHPELLVLGMASQSLVEQHTTDDFVFTD